CNGELQPVAASVQGRWRNNEDTPMRKLLWVLLVSPAAPLLLHAADAKEALWAAARTGDVKALESLLEKGADVNATNEIGISALWLAASKGHLEAVKVLIKHKADVNVRDGIWYQTPLSQAARRGLLEMTKVLLDAGAEGADELLAGAAGRGQVGIVPLFLEKRKPRAGPPRAAPRVPPKD